MNLPMYFGATIPDIPDLKKLVGGNNSVHFLRYHNNNLYYYTSDPMLIFPIPIQDLESAEIPCTERAMLCMKWIKKELSRLKDLEKELKNELNND